jgi:hypothetical protein
MVSSQKNIKRYHRLVVCMFLVVVMLIVLQKKCACVRVVYVCEIQDCVFSVTFARPKQAFNGIQLVANVEAVL